MSDLVSLAGPVLAALATGIPVALGVARYALSRQGPVWGLVDAVRAGVAELGAVRAELRALRPAVQDLADRLPAPVAPRGATTDEPDTEEGPETAPRRRVGDLEPEAPRIRVRTAKPDPLAVLSRPVEGEGGDLFEQVTRRARAT